MCMSKIHAFVCIHASTCECVCAGLYMRVYLVSESEIEILEVPVSAICHPLLLNTGIVVCTFHMDVVDTVSGAPFVCNGIIRDTHIK